MSLYRFSVPLSSYGSSISALSDNVAHVRTPFFKEVGSLFSEYIPGGSVYSGSAYRYYHDWKEGVLTATGRSLDLAVAGDGFLLTQPLMSDREKDGFFEVIRGASFNERSLDENFFYLADLKDNALVGWSVDERGKLPQTLSLDNVDIIRFDNNGFVKAARTEDLKLALQLKADPANINYSENQLLYLDTDNAKKLGVSSIPLKINFNREPVSGGSNTSWDVSFSSPYANVADPYWGNFHHKISFDSDGKLVEGETANFTGSWNLGGVIKKDWDILLDFSEVFMGSDGNISGTGVNGGHSDVYLSGYGTRRDGSVYGMTENGDQITLAQLAVVDVPNPNGLVETNLLHYKITENSGDYFPKDFSSGGVQVLEGYQEASNVKLEAELVTIIKTKVAYSALLKAFSIESDMLGKILTV